MSMKALRQVIASTHLPTLGSIGRTLVTVGASGRDYTTPQAAYNAIVAGTHGTATDDYLVIVDEGTYGTLSAVGSTGRNILWKARGSVASTIISGAGMVIDCRGPKTVEFEGITITNTAYLTVYIGSATAATVTFSKCISNSSSYNFCISSTNASHVLDAYIKNCTFNVTSPHVSQYEFENSTGANGILNVYLTNSSLVKQGAWSGSYMTLTVTDSDSNTFSSGSASNRYRWRAA